MGTLGAQALMIEASSNIQEAVFAEVRVQYFFPRVALAQWVLLSVQIEIRRPIGVCVIR